MKSKNGGKSYKGLRASCSSPFSFEQSEKLFAKNTFSIKERGSKGATMILDKGIILGFLIFFIALLVAYVIFTGYMAFWTYVVVTVWKWTRDLEPDEIFVGKNGFERWIVRIHNKKFGA